MENQQKIEDETYGDEDRGRLHQALSSVMKIFAVEDNKTAPGDPYPSENRNDAAATQR